jgi:hypothetical protein
MPSGHAERASLGRPVIIESFSLRAIISPSENYTSADRWSREFRIQYVFSTCQSVSISPFRDVLHTCLKEPTSDDDAVFCLDEDVHVHAIIGKIGIKQTILGR